MCRTQKPPPGNRGAVGTIRHIPHNNPGELGNVTGRKPLPGEKPWWSFRLAVNNLVASRLGHTGPFFVQDHRDSCRYKRSFLTVKNNRIRLAIAGAIVVALAGACTHDVGYGVVTDIEQKGGNRCDITIEGESDYGTEQDTHQGLGRVCEDVTVGDTVEIDEGQPEIEYADD